MNPDSLHAPLYLLLTGWSGIAAGTLIIMILLNQANPQTRRANYYLSSLVAVLILNLLNKGLFIFESSSLQAYVVAVNYSATLAAGPSLYFYVRQITDKQTVPSLNPPQHHKHQYWHWLAPLIACLLLETTAVIHSLQGTTSVVNLQVSPTSIWLFALPLTLSLGSYAVLSWRCIDRHRHQMADFFHQLSTVIYAGCNCYRR
jgi:hypothetical protein